MFIKEFLLRKIKLEHLELSHHSGPIAAGLAFLYKAFERPHQLVGHGGGIAFRRKARSHLHRFEVRSQRAVVLLRDSDVLSAEHAWIALHDGRGICFDECEVSVVSKLLALHVASQHAQIVSAWFHHAVVSQHRFQVHAQLCVSFQPMFVILHN